MSPIRIYPSASSLGDVPSDNVRDDVRLAARFNVNPSASEFGGVIVLYEVVIEEPKLAEASSRIPIGKMNRGAEDFLMGGPSNLSG